MRVCGPRKCLTIILRSLNGRSPGQSTIRLIGAPDLAPEPVNREFANCIVSPTADQEPLLNDENRMITHSDATYPAEPIRLRDNSARSPDETSDRELLAAIARANQQAMRRLYERHSEHVYRFARRLGVDESGAEDLVSEVFFEVWRCADAFEGRAQVFHLAVGDYSKSGTKRHPAKAARTTRENRIHNHRGRDGWPRSCHPEKAGRLRSDRGLAESIAGSTRDH